MYPFTVFVFFYSTGKTVHPKNVSSTSKKRAARRFGCSGRKRKPNQTAVTLVNFFKVKAKADRLYSVGLLPSEKPDNKTWGRLSSDSDQTVSQNKTTATSLILFEEVKQ